MLQLSTRVYSIAAKMKGCFVGSGSEGLQQPEVCEAIIALTKKTVSDITVLYLGTATYDLPGPKHNQTIRFIEAGCRITELKCAYNGDACGSVEMANLCNEADAIIVSGGNTLYAIDKWHSIGLVPHLLAAASRGAVLTGGSAGAICWFDAGHSDSADPDSYKDAMIREATKEANKDEASAAPENVEDVKMWEYMRVPCLGFLPGVYRH
jgi:dipeptidase E